MQPYQQPGQPQQPYQQQYAPHYQQQHSQAVQQQQPAQQQWNRPAGNAQLAQQPAQQPAAVVGGTVASSGTTPTSAGAPAGHGRYPLRPGYVLQSATQPQYTAPQQAAQYGSTGQYGAQQASPVHSVPQAQNIQQAPYGSQQPQRVPLPQHQYQGAPQASSVQEPIQQQYAGPPVPQQMAAAPQIPAPQIPAPQPMPSLQQVPPQQQYTGQLAHPRRVSAYPPVVPTVGSVAQQFDQMNLAPSVS